MPTIFSAAIAVPSNRYLQEDLLAMAGYHDELRRSFFLNSGIASRNLSFDPGFRGLETIDEMNGRAQRSAISLGTDAIARALACGGLAPRDLDFLATSTCTVSLCPQLDTHFIRTLEMRPGIQRVHVGDTGCASALVAVQAAHNYLKAFPGRKAAVACAEICSAAYYRDGSPEAAVGEAIFSDGAAAICLSDAGAGFEILEHRSLIRTEHQELMGFDFPGGKRRLVLSRMVAKVGPAVLTEWVHDLLAAHNLQKEDVRFWILHSAGRRILDNAQVGLGLTDDDLSFSRGVLHDYGNMSSATVLFVLERVMTSGLPRPGDLAVLAALGPGFATEGALLRWTTA